MPEICRRFLRNIFIPPCITKNSWLRWKRLARRAGYRLMKLDTGMHRLGVRPEQAEAFYHRLTQCKNVRQPVNIVSHFARADEPKCGATEKQLAIFNTFCEGKPGQRSIAASGGILLWPQSHFDWVRPGIILYGVSPLEDRSTGADFGCQPVMSLTSSLIAVREHKAGEPVGYGGTG